MVADIVEPESRGRHFGYIGCADAVGSVAGGVFATSVGGIALVGVLAGWRLVLLTIAAISILLALIAPCMGTDPRAATSSATLSATSAAAGGGVDGGMWSALRVAAVKAKAVLTIPTFQIILAQVIKMCTIIFSSRRSLGCVRSDSPRAGH